MNTKSKSMTALLNLVKAAVFAALIAVMTAYIKFNTGINDGYLHFGDSMIYLAACILPLPYAMAAAAIGGFCADILAGAAAWAPFTAIIKALSNLRLPSCGGTFIFVPHGINLRSVLDYSGSRQCNNLLYCRSGA